LAVGHAGQLHGDDHRGRTLVARRALEDVGVRRHGGGGPYSIWSSAAKAVTRSANLRGASACSMWPAPVTISRRACGSAASNASRVARKYEAERSPPSSSTGVWTAASSA